EVGRVARRTLAGRPAARADPPPRHRLRLPLARSRAGAAPPPGRVNVAARGPPGSPSVDAALAALPVGLPDLPLEQLARRVAGQRLGEVDRRRALVAGQALARVLDQLLG